MTTPSPLLRAKLAVGVLTVATMTATAVGAPSSLSTPTASAAPSRHVAVQLLSESIDSATTIGVADSTLYNLPPSELADRLSQMQSLGVTNLRVAVPWVFIEPAAGVYDWAPMDTLVQTASEMGFTITGSITGNPTWGGLPIAGAPNPAAYGQFAGSVAQRYGTQIANYEIWNEPNGVIFYAPISADSYTEVLKAAYTAIKAANPDATVLAGALGATGTVNGITLSPQQFLAQMYEAGAGGFFDALSYHPYHYSLPFSAGSGISNSPLEQAQQLYAIMAANGDAALKIWATEYGNATTPGWGVTQSEQAAFMADFLTAWSRLSYAGPAFVYTAADRATGLLNHEDNFGLFTSDGTPKLAAQMLAELIALGANGRLPDFTAPKLSTARELYLQLTSVGFGLANQALVIPHALIAVAYNLMPAAVQRAFDAVTAAVSLVASAVVTALAPVMQSAIEVALRMLPAATAHAPDAPSMASAPDTIAGDAGDAPSGEATITSVAGVGLSSDLAASKEHDLSEDATTDADEEATNAPADLIEAATVAASIDQPASQIVEESGTPAASPDLNAGSEIAPNLQAAGEDSRSASMSLTDTASTEQARGEQGRRSERESVGASGDDAGSVRSSRPNRHEGTDVKVPVTSTGSVEGGSQSEPAGTGVTRSGAADTVKDRDSRERSE